MLAVHRVTRHAAKKALMATLAIDGLRSGASPDRAPTMIPIDAGLAKLHMAKVAIADDLG